MNISTKAIAVRYPFHHKNADIRLNESGEIQTTDGLQLSSFESFCDFCKNTCNCLVA